MMDKVHKLDASRLSMFKSMLQSICASKGRGSLGPKSRPVLPLFNKVFIEHPSPFCVKNCSVCLNVLFQSTLSCQDLHSIMVQ